MYLVWMDDSLTVHALIICPSLIIAISAPFDLTHSKKHDSHNFKTRRYTEVKKGEKAAASAERCVINSN
jgi:hypothetical protein